MVLLSLQWKRPARSIIRQMASPTPPRPNNVCNLITLTFGCGRQGCQSRWSRGSDLGDAFVSHCFLFLWLFKFLTINSDFLLYQAYVCLSLRLERFSFCHRLPKRRPGRCHSMAMIHMALWTLRGWICVQKGRELLGLIK